MFWGLLLYIWWLRSAPECFVSGAIVRAQFQSLGGLGIDVQNSAANASALMTTQLSIHFTNLDATLGTDDNMAFQLACQVYDSSNRLVPAQVQVTFGVPKYTYAPTFLGSIPTHTFVPSFAACSEMVSPFQQKQPAFESALHTPDLVHSNLSGLYAPPNPHILFAHEPTPALPPKHKYQSFDRINRREWGDRDPHLGWRLRTAQRRLETRLSHLAQRVHQHMKGAAVQLAALTVIPPKSGESDYDISPAQYKADQLAASVADGIINPMLETFKTNSSLLTNQAVLNANFTLTLQGALRNLTFAKSQTVNFLNDSTVFNAVLLNASTDVTNLASSLNQTTQQALSILQDAQKSTNAQLDALAAQVAGATFATTVEADTYYDMVSQLQAFEVAILASIAYLRSAMDAELETIKKALTAIDDYRLDKNRNRLESQSLYELTTVLSGFGLQPFESANVPVITPLGFVPIPPGTLPYFLVLVYIYNFKAYPSSAVESALFPDPDVSADTVASLPLDAQNNYNNLMLAAAQPAISNTFVGLRSLGFQCNRDFLLENGRDLFITAYNFMNMIGPPGCTPGVDCQCWVVVQSERCSTAQPFGYNASGTVITTLAQAPGLCADNTDLQTWFNPVTNTGPDVSPTQLSSTYNLTAASDVLALLQSFCQITLLGAVDPNDPMTNPGSFLLHTSSFEISPTQLGNFLRIKNDPTKCSTNHQEMETQSIVQGFDTIIYASFQHLRYAAGLLFSQSSGNDEVAKYGSGNTLGSSYDQIPFHAYTENFTSLSWEQLDNYSRSGVDLSPYLTHIRDCEVVTTLFTGPSTHPVFVHTLQTISQEVTVTLQYTDTNGLAQSTSYTTDQVQRADVPTNPLPESFVQVGSGDCIWNLCPDYKPSLVLSNYVMDFPPAGGGVLSMDINEEARRNTASYTLDQAAVLVPDPDDSTKMIPPFFSDSNYIFPKPVMNLDEWLRQNNKTKFEPRYATVSPADFLRHLVADTITGYPRCDPTEVTDSPYGEGLMCSILRQTRRLLPADLGAVLDQERQAIWSPLQWSADVTVVVQGSDLTLLPPLRLVCPDPNLIRIDTTSSSGTMATLQYKNTHSYAVLVLMIVQASNDPKAGLTPRFTNTTYGLAAGGIYLVNATENPSLTLTNVSCTRHLLHYTLPYEQVTIPLPLPVTCNNQNLAIRFWSIDLTGSPGFLTTTLTSSSIATTPNSTQLLDMYRNATATTTLARSRVQLCWQQLSVNVSDMYQRQKNIFYNGDIRTSTTGLVNSSNQSLLGTQITDLRNYTLSSISAAAAAAAGSGSSIYSRTFETLGLQSVLTPLLLFNASAVQWLSTVRTMIDANNRNLTSSNQTSNISYLLDQVQALWVTTQKRQQQITNGAVDITTNIPALQNTSSVLGAQIQSIMEKIRQTQVQAASAAKLVEDYVAALNLTALDERLDHINETSATLQAQAAFLSAIQENVDTRNLTSIRPILSVGGAAPSLTAGVYDNTAAGNAMLDALFGFALEVAKKVVGIATKVLKIGENLLDLALLLTEPDSGCFLGLHVMCTIGNILRYVAIGLGVAVVVGITIFIIVKTLPKKPPTPSSSTSAPPGGAVGGAAAAAVVPKTGRGGGRRPRKLKPRVKISKFKTTTVYTRK